MLAMRSVTLGAADARDVGLWVILSTADASDASDARLGVTDGAADAGDAR